MSNLPKESQKSKEFDLKLEEYKRVLQEKLDAAVNVLKMQMDKLIQQCFDNKLKINEMESDIKNCYNMIKQVDDATEAKIQKLEIQSNIDQNVIGGSIESRVYLNDHLTLAAKRIVAVRVEMNFGTVKAFNYDECIRLLDESPGPSYQSVIADIFANQPVVDNI
ncbi:hypothetical protein FF38_04415 [Lucilia cuprina]|uniref:Uncharacterized protein n=1 Tax=Lucilia cuprina TaxID=7375 RepID=A0A0L0BSI4_LUCCU|nr:hypothetical protein FF38_04415 [Lucilia cuprina]